MKTYKTFIEESFFPPEIKRLMDELPKSIGRSVEWKRSNIDTYFKRYGWERLGMGGWAKVYGHPSKDYVVKVFSNDSYYTKWIRFMQQNQNNRYIPKLRGHPLYLSNGLCIIRMERLVKVTREQHLTFLEFRNDPSAWDKDFQKVHDFLDKYGMYEDLGGPDNIMLKGSQIKITDPLAE